MIIDARNPWYIGMGPDIGVPLPPFQNTWALLLLCYMYDVCLIYIYDYVYD